MNIYVGNLSFNATEGDLREAFSQYGEVTSCSIITDKFSQQSKGFGFVEMSNKEEALKAIQGLNGQEFGGRALTVNEARPKEDRGGGGGGGGRDRRW
jgi:cold-inducible RNA-binding protein